MVKAIRQPGQLATRVLGLVVFLGRMLGGFLLGWQSREVVGSVARSWFPEPWCWKQCPYHSWFWDIRSLKESVRYLLRVMSVSEAKNQWKGVQRLRNSTLYQWTFVSLFQFRNHTGFTFVRCWGHESNTLKAWLCRMSGIRLCLPDTWTKSSKDGNEKVFAACTKPIGVIGHTTWFKAPSRLFSSASYCSCAEANQHVLQSIQEIL
jgi:hypothetical protein